MDLFQACCKSRDLLGAVLSAIRHAIVVVDHEGKILMTNAVVGSMFGVDVAKMEGKDLSVFFTPEDMLHLYPNLLRMARQKRSFEGELTLVRTDETRFFAFMVFRPYVVPDQDFPLSVVCIHDIDKQKRPEEGLRGTHYEDLIKIADGIAHELRNPLVAIGGSSKRLYTECGKTPDTEKYYDRILNNVKRLEGLVENVEFFAHLPKPCMKEESIRKLVQEAISPYLGQIQDQNVILVNQIQDMVLRLDKNLVLRAFSILIDNALDAMPSGGELTLTSVADGNTCRVYVADTGTGISPEDLPYIFNPFFRTKATGIGIDLTVVKRIMSRHGGQVGVNSTPGKGTTFEMAFPLERRRSIRVTTFKG
ncbi:MAG: PAS domain S-box protein [Deltaproteobacteria bacterium]|nr:PAS domain S-box protein [Deltaproteobacteria bacterium]